MMSFIATLHVKPERVAEFEELQTRLTHLAYEHERAGVEGFRRACRILCGCSGKRHSAT